MTQSDRDFHDRCEAEERQIKQQWIAERIAKQAARDWAFHDVDQQKIDFLKK